MITEVAGPIQKNERFVPILREILAHLDERDDWYGIMLLNDLCNVIETGLYIKPGRYR